MYVPREYRETDREKILQFMREHSFATLVSVDNGVPVATHLPFVIQSHGEEITLLTHMALGNQQKKSLDGEVLVIFQGPHSYVSPSNYEDKARVPTWNYVAVHAYGKASVLKFEQYDETLRTIIDEYEPSYMKQYEELPKGYKESNMRAIVCIEISVTRLEASYKLSQDKPHGDRERVILRLRSSDDFGKQELADEMERSLKTDLRSGSSE
jgi:transcriptional regulator